jgi:hypothetical protein
MSNENEFQKLLNEAPALPETDTVTVVGVLARTADAARFFLMLPNGHAETLHVAAVRSSRKVAGTIGQPVVELVLDARQLPENVRNILSGWGYIPPVTGVGGGTGTHAHKDIFEGTVAPFVAATPHQVHPDALAALAISGSVGQRTYFNATDWTTDHHTIAKAHTDGPF